MMLTMCPGVFAIIIFAVLAIVASESFLGNTLALHNLHTLLASKPPHSVR